MAIDFDLLEVEKLQMTACNGDAMAWVLKSRRASGREVMVDFAILVVPNDKIGSLHQLDALSRDVPSMALDGTLEQWLQQYSDSGEEAKFTFCLDLPVFTLANHGKVRALVEAIRLSLPEWTWRLYGISPNLRNWKMLQLNGVVQSEFNHSQAAGAHLFKFFAGLISPRAGACLDSGEFEDVIRDPENPGILLQAIWNGDGETPTLTMEPGDLEILKCSSAIVAVSAGTPFQLMPSRVLVGYFLDLAAHVEFAHAMNHGGILWDPDVPVQGDVPIHLICRRLLWVRPQRP